MIAKLVDAFFGCWHSRYSFPITVRPASRKGFRPSTGGSADRYVRGLPRLRQGIAL